MYVNLDTVINKSTAEVRVNGGCCGGTVFKQQWTDKKNNFTKTFNINKPLTTITITQFHKQAATLGGSAGDPFI